MFVTMFPAIVNIDPWLQEILYGALSIFAITVFPEGVVGLAKRRLATLFKTFAAPPASPVAPSRSDASAEPSHSKVPAPAIAGGAAAEAIVECRGIDFGYGQGPKVLRKVDLSVKRGHIHGLIGPNGSGKSTLANIIAGRLRPLAGTTHVKGVLLPSGRRDGTSMQSRAEAALRSVGAGSWIASRVGDVPHGIEQLTQLASVRVAGPEIIILDEPATGLSLSEVDHLARLLGELKAQGVTMIIIEHQTRFLFPLCDQVTVLNAGEVILTSTADVVRADPVVRQIYLGE
jgi:branched-chain amino acid transport system permease protein